MLRFFAAESDEVAVLRAIILGRRAWVAAEDLRASPGVLAGLESAGWITPWDRDALGTLLVPGSWTLTSWAAEVLGVELDETPFAEVPFWVATGNASVSVVQPPQERTVPLRHPERVVDTHPGPEYLVDDDGEPITIAGVPVEIDPRLKGRREPSATGRRRTHPRRRKATRGRST